MFNQKSSSSVLGKRRRDLEDDIHNLRAEKHHLQNDYLCQLIAMEEQKLSTASKIHLLQAQCDDLQKKKTRLESEPLVWGAKFFHNPSQTPRPLHGVETINHIFQTLQYHYLPPKKDLEGHILWREMEEHLGQVESGLRQVQAQYYLWGPKTNPHVKKRETKLILPY
jgi:hypothetical protein